MSNPTIATHLFMLMASGGTLERVIAGMPMFKTQIESARDWMAANGQCPAADIERRALSLRDVILRKEVAIRKQDFDLAASMRAEECALYHSLGLPAQSAWHSVLRGDIERQIKDLAALLQKELCQN